MLEAGHLHSVLLLACTAEHPHNASQSYKRLHDLTTAWHFRAYISALSEWTLLTRRAHAAVTFSAFGVAHLRPQNPVCYADHHLRIVLCHSCNAP
jgi:predicted RNA-binding protein